MIVVLWGVSGCGKSTVGRLLADQLNWAFHDADGFHPPANVEKMRAGIPLDDEDRYPWLDQLATLISTTNRDGACAVLACSALKQHYRDRLGINHVDVCAVHLRGTEALIGDRLRQRHHDFMNSKLLTSQFEALEPAGEGLSLDITSEPPALCRQIISSLELTKE